MLNFLKHNLANHKDLVNVSKKKKTVGTLEIILIFIKGFSLESQSVMLKCGFCA